MTTAVQASPMLKHLPNALTLMRLVLAPIVAWAVWRADLGVEPVWAMTAAILFVLAALTDLFDGMAARAFGAESKFGRVVDPIADKALVGLPLIALSIVLHAGAWPYWPLVAGATAVIVGRDALMTWLRLTAPDGEGARVSPLAKWKTALELIAVAAPILASTRPDLVDASFEGIVGGGLSAATVAALVWLCVLLLAAALSAFTAYRYLAAK